MFSFSGPAEVRGPLQRMRNSLQPVLILIFLLMPWIKINGKPFILFDIFNRNFIFFGFTFYSHDTPLLFFILILVILSIFLITALFGRIWCGWICPQTVFLHSVFNKIESFILGSYTKRRALFDSEDSFNKKFKKTLIYTIFLGVCWIMAHSLVAYFIGANTVMAYIFDGPSLHMKSFSILLIMTIVLFLNFTFFREKLCFFICPYGRFQNAMIDRNSLSVFYDRLRGEPKGKLKAVNPFGRGDCIDCNRCVHVCPTKIDIRNGFQLECIACGKCIDACNEVMTKINRKPNLISYETVNQKPITLKRFRLGLYAALILVFSTTLIISLIARAPVDLSISRSHTEPFSIRYNAKNKILQNQVVFHFKNQTQLSLVVELSLAELDQKRGFQLVSPATHLVLEPGQDIKTFGFIEIDGDQFQLQDNKIKIEVTTDKFKMERDFQFIKVN